MAKNQAQNSIKKKSYFEVLQCDNKNQLSPLTTLPLKSN